MLTDQSQGQPMQVSGRTTGGRDGPALSTPLVAPVTCRRPVKRGDLTLQWLV